MGRYFKNFGDSDVQLPTRGTSKSAGYDFYLPTDVILPPHKTTLVKSGVTAYMEDDEFLQISLRSGLSLKHALLFTNGVGIIDADYCGKEIGFIIHNLEEEPLRFEKGTRIAQGIFKKYYITDNDDPVSSERTGGYGSTGK